MSYEVEPIVVNTDDVIPPKPSEGMWDNRRAAYCMYEGADQPKCTIAVLGYNRLNKTKYCVECILKYTQDIDYELFLVDNASSDGTYEYFQSVPYEKKQIIKITKNIGASYPWTILRSLFRGRYLVFVSNDVYVTQNWLSNLLKCYESDPRIGFIEPLSSNVSNFQQLDLEYSDFEQMQKKAAAINKSDTSKWSERMRLVSIINIMSRDVIDNVGLGDAAFVHDFAEDDFSIRLRRNGYKLMLCEDTWICHDHDFRNMEDKNPNMMQKTLRSGRQTYLDKYHGIDPWDDINNYEPLLLSPLRTASLNKTGIKALSIDVRCGTPVLEIRNHLRKRGISNVKSYSFTTQAKYYLDLQTVSDNVRCDRIDYIQSYYADNFFDLLVLGEPLNIYPTSITMLQRLYNFVKPGGVMLFKLRNTDDFNTFLRTTGLGGTYDEDLSINLPQEEITKCLKMFGARSVSVKSELENLSEADQTHLLTIIRAVKPQAGKEDVSRLMTKYYHFCVVKK